MDFNSGLEFSQTTNPRAESAPEPLAVADSGHGSNAALWVTALSHPPCKLSITCIKTVSAPRSGDRHRKSDDPP